MEGTLNLDGGTLNLNGGMRPPRPPYNLSTVYTPYFTKLHLWTLNDLLDFINVEFYKH